MAEEEGSSTVKYITIAFMAAFVAYVWLAPSKSHHHSQDASYPGEESR